MDVLGAPIGGSEPSAVRQGAPYDPASGAAQTLPGDTTPTWQGELLLSGGVVFALLQLPTLFDAIYADAIPRLSEGRYWVATYAYLYASCANYSLIIAFVAHLGLRAWWIALVGLNSVYPQGPRWENFRAGPVALDLARAHFRPLHEHIARIDNHATLVFSIGVLIAVIAAFLGALTVLIVGFGAALASAVGRPEWFTSILVALVTMVFLPLTLGGLVDRWLLPRLPVDTGLRRPLRALLQAFNSWTRASVWTDPLNVFTTQHAGSKGSRIVFGALFVMLVGAALTQSIQRGGLAWDSFAAFPARGGAYLVEAIYYRDQRTSGGPVRSVPTISSATPSGDWMPLFVPFSARADSAMLARHCPTVKLEPLSSPREPELSAVHAAEHQRRRDLIECIVGLRPVTLDGNPVNDLSWDFYRDPETDLPGLLTMIPLRGMASGRHEISVARTPDPEANEPEKLADPHRIVFWR